MTRIGQWKKYFLAGKEIDAAEKCIPQPDSVFFQSVAELEKRYVDREEFILNLAKDKRVLHFGFLDVPFLAEKIKEGRLLHTRLRSVSKVLHGVDIDTKSLAKYRRITKDTNNSIFDVQDIKADFSAYSNKYDLIIFGEVLEHVMNPGLALAGLNQICKLNKKCQLCVTVPNVFSFTAFVSALNGVEAVHPDHYYYFSPYTLQRLLHDNGFSKVKLYQYSWGLKTRGATGNGLVAVAEI